MACATCQRKAGGALSSRWRGRQRPGAYAALSAVCAVGARGGWVGQGVCACARDLTWLLTAGYMRLVCVLFRSPDGGAPRPGG